jgi:hypothetical protein
LFRSGSRCPGKSTRRRPVWRIKRFGGRGQVSYADGSYIRGGAVTVFIEAATATATTTATTATALAISPLCTLGVRSAVSGCIFLVIGTFIVPVLVTRIARVCFVSCKCRSVTKRGGDCFGSALGTRATVAATTTATSLATTIRAFAGRSTARGRRRCAFLVTGGIDFDVIGVEKILGIGFVRVHLAFDGHGFRRGRLARFVGDRSATLDLVG